MEKGAEKIAEVSKMKMGKTESLWAFPILDQEGLLRSLKRKWPVCDVDVDDDDEEIPLIEFCRRMKKEQKTKTIMWRQVSIRSPLSAKSKKKNPLIRSQDKRKNKLEEEEENKNKLEEENKNKLEEEKKPMIPVFEGSFSQYDIDAGMESEEEVLGDGDRDEYDRGSKFVLNENSMTYTRLKHPIKVYHRRSKWGSVLHDPSYPVPTVTKLALDRYNAIEGTNYKYVGLVKAYRIQVNGSRYTVRFKARLPDKRRPINFQAMIWQHIRNKKKEVLVDVDFVHPLP